MKLYTTSVSQQTDKILCEFLCSPDREKDIRFYKKKNRITIDEPTDKVSRRLRFLKNTRRSTPESFVEHCGQYGLEPSHIDPNAFQASIELASSTIPQSSNNKFGRSIVIALPLGVFFCVVYPTTKFGTRIQISISSDGKTIELIQPRQIPRNASDLLSGYPFAHDQHNIVYATVDAEIYRMKKEMNEWDTKVESTLLEFQEEMNPFFVDQLGNYTNTYESNEEEQRITFFVRTMASTRTMKGNSWCNNNHLPQSNSPYMAYETTVPCGSPYHGGPMADDGLVEDMIAELEKEVVEMKIRAQK